MNTSPATVRHVTQWLLALAALYALFSALALAHSQELMATVTDLPLLLLLQFLALTTLAFALRALRWCHLARAVGITGNPRHTAEIYLGGFPMTFTPGRVGELWRAWALRRQRNISYRRALPLVLGDRLLDLNALLLFAALGIFIASDIYRLSALAAILITLPIVTLLLSPNLCRRAIKRLWQLSDRRWPRQFASALAACRHIAAIVKPTLYLPALALSLAAWSIEAYAIHHIATQLGGTLSPTAAMATLGLGNIVGVLTFLPGGVGGQEATMIYLLQQHGNTIIIAATITGIARVGTVFYAALLGMPFFIRHSRRASA